MRLIVPWPPGRSTDTVARISRPKQGKVLGQPVIIDTRGPAQASIKAVRLHLPRVRTFARHDFAGFETPTWGAFLGRAERS
jgi:tripartite-type tricarboxylate transporter receptor subunit TctC